MYLILIISMVIVSVLMCLIVLIQKSKGGGLSSAFASSNKIFSVRKEADFLEKTTWTLAGLMVIFSILSAYTLPSNKAVEQSAIMKQAQEEAATNPYSMPLSSDAPVLEMPTAATDSASN
ncbi:MAG: preprotein translocase subunit SecG [Bacteroides sp.]|nr:preprotein translocase subunit SecG [Bacteroides sp.]